MSFNKIFWNLSLRKCLPIKLVRLIFQMVILNKTFGKFSFRNSAYSRTIRSRNSFQEQFQTENFCSFIFHSFANKIQNQQSADSFQRNLCQLQVSEQQLGQLQFRQTNPAFQSRSLQNRILPTSAWKSSFQRTLANSFQTNSFQNSSFRTTSFRRTPFSSSAWNTPASQRRPCTTSLQQPLPRTA